MTNVGNPDEINMRQSPRKGVDLLVFNNADYLIYRKNASEDVIASLWPDISFIGLVQLRQTIGILQEKQDKLKFIENIREGLNKVLDDIYDEVDPPETDEDPNDPALGSKLLT